MQARSAPRLNAVSIVAPATGDVHDELAFGGASWCSNFPRVSAISHRNPRLELPFSGSVATTTPIRVPSGQNTVGSLNVVAAVYGTVSGSAGGRSQSRTTPAESTAQRVRPLSAVAYAWNGAVLAWTVRSN